MKKITILIFLILVGCGGNTQIRNIQVNNLEIIESISSTYCKTGKHHQLYLKGIINDDSVVIVEKVLQQMPRCLDDKGRYNVTVVFLNSRGGYLADGFKMGKLFTQYQIQTIIGDGDVCMSACSTAFLGGYYRSMWGNAKLVVHAPYIRTSPHTIECQSKSRAEDLKSYYVSRLGNSQGDLLFERTMQYCSSSNGWTLNKDAAQLFGLLN